MGCDGLDARATGWPAGSITVAITRTSRASFSRFSTSVRMATTARVGWTVARTNVPHCFTRTGAVLTSQT